MFSKKCRALPSSLNNIPRCFNCETFSAMLNAGLFDIAIKK